MNCKQGDLALIIISKAGNEGKMVTCVKFVGDTPINSECHDCWEIDRILITNDGRLTNLYSDAWLLPIAGAQQFKEARKERYYD